jgi:hypothetical protein
MFYVYINTRTDIVIGLSNSKFEHKIIAGHHQQRIQRQQTWQER